MISEVLSILLFAIAIVVARVVMAKAKLPPLAPFGARDPSAASRYLALKEPAIAWEGGLGWQVNERPASLSGPAPIDELVLTPRLLQFCSRSSGRLALVFNFLVAAIENVRFDPATSSSNAPPGSGLLTISTPSGQTLVVASAQFAQTLTAASHRG